jgi:uncharacterized protein YlxP (DUF503 family)
MIVGVCTIELYLGDSGSLKSKRQILRKLKDRTKNAFNVSISEIDHHDLWQRTTLGVAIITTDTRFANRVLCKVVDFIAKEPRAEILDWTVEMR